jgi:hypothetical protein
MDANQRHAQAQHEVRQTSREDAPTLLKTSKSNEIERRLIELTSLVQNQDESDN